MTSADAYLNGVVIYAGLPVRRYVVERYLDRLGVAGPAWLGYGRLPAVDEEPLSEEDFLTLIDIGKETWK